MLDYLTSCISISIHLHSKHPLYMPSWKGRILISKITYIEVNQLKPAKAKKVSQHHTLTKAKTKSINQQFVNRLLSYIKLKLAKSKSRS